MKLAYYQSIDPSDPLPKLGRKVEKSKKPPANEYAGECFKFRKCVRRHRIDALDAALSTAFQALHSIPQGEHVVLTTNAALDDGWIAWGGGECPTDESAIIDIRFRDGSRYEARTVSRGLRWDHIGSSADIIAYRIHKQPEARTSACMWSDVLAASRMASIRSTQLATTIAWDAIKRDSSRPLREQPDCWPAAIAALEALK